MQPCIGDGAISIPGYSIFRKAYISSHPKYGVCLFATLSLQVLLIDTEIPTVLVVRLPDYGIVLVVVYRPPSYSQQENDYLLEELERLSLMHGEIILLGDFNLPNVDWSGCYQETGLTRAERQFHSLFDSLGFTQWVHDGTYLYSNNILDLVLTSEPDRVINLELYPPFSHCGHLLVKFEWLFDTSQAKNDNPFIPASLPKYIWRRANFQNIRRDLELVNWEFEFGLGNIEENYSFLTEVMKSCMSIHVPTLNLTGTSINVIGNQK